jgi:hypothetical protein
MPASTPETPGPGSNWDWATVKDRLAIASVVIVLLVLVFFLIDGTIVNLRCSFWQFVTFECNRWDARWRPWD